MAYNESMSNAVSGFGDMYQNLKENNLIYIGLFIVILLCILTIYFLYTMIGNYLFLKVSNTVYETTVPVLCNKASSFDANFADMGNGRRRSYSFWIYIYDINKNYGTYKTVAAVSNESNYSDTSSSAYLNASPHIFLDKTNNSMYCHFNDKQITKDLPFQNFTAVHDIEKYMKTGIKIDYIPIQRWVHVAIVVNSDTFTTSIYAYVDGDLVKVGRDKEPIAVNNPIRNEYEKIDLNKTRYLLVGGDNANVRNGPGFSGLLSNFTCYNYELNQSDVSNIYRQGPVSGILAYLGLGMYGVRNPIYKL
jgi:hypothetical protein